MLKKLLKFLRFYLWQKQKIPKGDYCYKIKNIEYPTDKGKLPIIHTKVCPYWRRLDGEEGDLSAYCRLIDYKSMLLWDQCKECNIKIGDENC